jgi:hypothetical protein
MLDYNGVSGLHSVFELEAGADMVSNVNDDMRCSRRSVIAAGKQ